VTIQILIVEDDPLIAMDLKDIVQQAGYTDVRTAATMDEARTELDYLEEGFVFLDINLDQRQGGTVLAAEIRQKYSFPFAFVTANTDDETLQKVQQTKPVGFIVKPFDEKEILAVLKMGIFTIQNQQRSKPQTVTTELIQRVFPSLSQSESKVLQGLYEARTNQEIADYQHLSVNTIKTHLKSLYLKLDVASRMEAVQKLMSKI
jgi:DNA-binding NarL/FixJ family response regulator